MKKILFVLSKAPYTGAYSQELLDLALTAAAFDQNVALALFDDAVFHLKKNQRTEESGPKNISMLFKALPLYDIETILVETESLQERGLVPDDLVGPVTLMPRQQIGELWRQFDLILTG